VEELIVDIFIGFIGVMFGIAISWAIIADIARIFYD